MERIDDIGFGGLKLIQDTTEFCYGVDAVLLADFASKVCKPQPLIIADMGTGTGVIPLMLSHMTTATKIIGIEIQERSFELANRNVKLNNLDEKIEIICADVADAQLLKDKIETFDLVVSNPPYVKKNGGIINDSNAKMIARHETTADLDDFVRTAANLLKPTGNFCMVHRPDRIVDICELCRKHRLEPKNMRFVSPNKNKAANILLVHCVKYGNANLNLFDPLYIYDEVGEYTHEIDVIYGRAKMD